MSNAKHTPGPWQVHQFDKLSIHKAGKQPDYIGKQIGATSYFAGTKRIEAEANARLIAAAPDLLDACKAADREFADCFDADSICDHSVGVCFCDYWRFREKMKQVIAKAEGNQ